LGLGRYLTGLFREFKGLRDLPRTGGDERWWSFPRGYWRERAHPCAETTYYVSSAG